MAPLPYFEAWTYSMRMATSPVRAKSKQVRLPGRNLNSHASPSSAHLPGRKALNPGFVRARRDQLPRDLDAAEPFLGGELRGEPLRAEPFEDTVDEREVHAAHELGVLGGQAVEGTVGEADLPVGDAGLVPVVGEDVRSELEVVPAILDG